MSTDGGMQNLQSTITSTIICISMWQIKQIYLDILKLTKKDLQVTYCIFQRFPSSCWKWKFEDNLLKAYVYLSWYVRQTLSIQRNTWQTLLGNHMTVCVPYNIILHKDLISGQEINFSNPLAQWASRFQFSLAIT